MCTTDGRRGTPEAGAEDRGAGDTSGETATVKSGFDGKTKSLIRKLEFDRPGGRVWGKFAGFWFNRNQYGLLPWQWSRFQRARIEVWRIN